MGLAFLIQVLTDIEQVMNEFVAKTQSYITQLAKLQQIYKVHDIPLRVNNLYNSSKKLGACQATAIDDSLSVEFKNVNLSYKDFDSTEDRDGESND